MPKYHCLNTEVQLYTWDPALLAPPPLISPSASLPVPVFDLGLSSSPSLGAVFSLSSSNHEWVSSRDPAGSCETAKVKERFFKGYEGVNFLGNHTPFYLIRTVQDLNIVANPVPCQVTIPSLHSSHQQFDTSQSSLTDSTLSDIDAELFKDVCDSFDGASMISTSYASAMDDATPLMNVSRSFIPSQTNEKRLTSLSPNLDMPNSKELEGTDRLFVQRNSPSLLGSGPDFLVTPSCGSRGSIVGPMPMKIVVKLSDASFVSPFLSPEKKRYDICISIFFNGEFTTSDIICYSRWSADNGTKSAHYSGKRVQPNQEVPWIIDLDRHRDDSPPPPFDKIHRMQSPSERWKVLSEALLHESDIWSVGENRRQTPVGAYLEQLSTQTMPQEVNICSITGKSFGVIDVVISYGNSIYRNEAASCDMLRRKLQQAPGQPKEHEDRSISKVSYSVEVIGTTPFLNPLLCSTKPASSASFTDQEGSKLFSAALDTTKLHSSPSERGGRIDSTQLVTITSGKAISPPAAPIHPGRPKVVPQKRYRGLDPEPVSTKRARALGPSSTSISTPVSMATRSKCSAGTTTDQTPQSCKSASLETINGTTKTVEISMSTPATGLDAFNPPMPLTGGRAQPQKRDKVVIPKTPKSAIKLGKQGKPINYNPKYSNRPQNLRRKNSVGEWETPTKPRWQVETAHEGVDDDRSKKEEELRRIRPPDFNLSKTKGGSATLTGPLTIEEMSMSNGAFSLDLNAVSATPKNVQSEKVALNEKAISNMGNSLSAATASTSKIYDQVAVLGIEAIVGADSFKRLKQTLVQTSPPKPRFMVPNHKFKVISEHKKVSIGVERSDTDNDNQPSTTGGRPGGPIGFTAERNFADPPQARSLRGVIATATPYCYGSKPPNDGNMVSGATSTKDISIKAKDRKLIMEIGPHVGDALNGEPEGKLSATLANSQSQNRRSKCVNELKALNYTRNREGLADYSQAPMSDEMKRNLMAEAKEKVIAYKTSQVAESVGTPFVIPDQIQDGHANRGANHGAPTQKKKICILKMGKGSRQSEGPGPVLLREASQVPTASNKPTGKQSPHRRRTCLPRRFITRRATGESEIGVDSKVSISTVENQTSLTKINNSKAARKPSRVTGESLMEIAINPAVVKKRGALIQDISNHACPIPVVSLLDGSAAGGDSCTKNGPTKSNEDGSTMLIRKRQSKVGEDGVLIAIDKETKTKTKTARKEEQTTTSSQTSKVGPSTATTFTTPPLPDYAQPPPLCQDSVLTYATTQTWPGLFIHPATGQALRLMSADNDEDCFEAAGVVMGVRYVIGV